MIKIYLSEISGWFMAAVDREAKLCIHAYSVINARVSLEQTGELKR